jgi:hypothetical protein
MKFALYGGYLKTAVFLFLLTSLCRAQDNDTSYNSPVYDDYEDSYNFNYLKGSRFHFALTPSDYMWLSLGVNGEVINTADMNKAMQIEITSGRYVDDYNYIQLIGRFGWGFLKDKSRLNKYIKSNLKIYSVGLEFKSLFPSFYTDLVQYLLAGVSFNSYSWKYQDPANSSYYDPELDGMVEDNIESDRLNACDLHLGVGCIVNQTKSTQLCLEFSPGYLLAGRRSSEGFDNVLLSSTFYFKVKLALYFAYRRTDESF